MPLELTLDALYWWTRKIGRVAGFRILICMSGLYLSNVLACLLDFEGHRIVVTTSDLADMFKMPGKIGRSQDNTTIRSPTNRRCGSQSWLRKGVVVTADIDPRTDHILSSVVSYPRIRMPLWVHILGLDRHASVGQNPPDRPCSRLRPMTRAGSDTAGCHCAVPEHGAMAVPAAFSILACSGLLKPDHASTAILKARYPLST